MTVNQIYAIYDVVAELITGPLMMLPNDAVARRTFQDAILGEGSRLTSHAADYVLIRLGSVDMWSGQISPVTAVLEQDHVISGDVIMELQNRDKETLNAV